MSVIYSGINASWREFKRGNGVLFKDKALKYIFAVSLAMAVLFPLGNLYIIYPLFSGILIENAGETAAMVAGHLKSTVVSKNNLLDGRVDLSWEAEALREDPRLLKIKVFSSAGEVLYSTDPEDVGKVNSMGYFREKVARGNRHTIKVKKASAAPGGGKAALDVVETCVPVMEGERFLGAFEFHYDITGGVRKLDNVVLYSSAIPLATGASFMLLVVFLLLKAARNIKGRRRMESELRGHRNNLEHAVSERTSELVETNLSLEQEIAERRQAEGALKRSERFLSTIFDSIHDPFCIFDRDFRVVRANEGYARLKNIKVQDLVGRTCYEALEGGTGVCEKCVVERTIISGDPCAKDKEHTLPDGTAMWIEIYTYPIYDEEGRITYVIEYTRDITDRKIAEQERKRLIEELELISRIDGLTGLCNRRELIKRLRHEMDRAARYDTQLSLIICDVDSFKGINDTYGHLAGDRALRGVADTIAGMLRKTDIAGRYGGDEFLIVLPATDTEGARVFAERLRAEIEQEKVELSDHRPVSMSISLGVSSYRPGMASTDDMIVPADSALYASKQEGRNKVTVYKAAPGEEVQDMQSTIPFD